jgi:hypothetical protein
MRGMGLYHFDAQRSRKTNNRRVTVTAHPALVSLRIAQIGRVALIFSFPPPTLALASLLQR